MSGSKPKRVVLQGVPASPGFAIGPAYLLHPEERIVKKRIIPAERVDQEVARLKRALDKAHKEILGIKTRISGDVGEYEARIFDTHMMMLQDSEIVDTVIKDIHDNLHNAEYAYSTRINSLAERFENISGGFLKDHMSDLRDVATRVIDILMLSENNLSYLDVPEPVIVMSRNLTPSVLSQFNRKNTLGLTIEVGGKTSHVSILARSLEIPAVSGIALSGIDIEPGQMVILDGTAGFIILNPSLRDIKEYEIKKAAFFAMERELSTLRDLEPVTTDGKYIELSANIELPIEVESVLQYGADSVGLYRSEFLFLTREDMPSEEEQYQAYKYIGERMSPRAVTIRTMDAGGDKLVPALKMAGELNPYMGWRSIRVCLDNREIFKTQLRAIMRATAYSNIRLMFPMISNLWEIRETKRMLDDVRKELDRDGIAYNAQLEIGCMVEVPAAVVMADELAREVDFFSIGTNDLIQFTLAVDRANERIAELFEPNSPAVWRQIKSVIEVARRHGIQACVCGEMAGDPLAAIVLIGMGIDELSMGPGVLLEMKKLIRSISFEEARLCSEEVIKLTTADEIGTFLRGRYGLKLADLGITKFPGKRPSPV
ncbi:MAG: phosphoenolpyruvate--protein phosphotransferase [Fibrobacterota bacterium]|nr:phosphoenolpyruvate--protein phosphotransferase [Fibrobacterota bacterium]